MEERIMNCLGALVREEMAWRDWDLAELAARTSLSEDELLRLFDGERLADWPSSRVVHALGQAFRIPTQDLVLLAAQACGLAVEREAPRADLATVGNEDLMRELRRRLVLGASTGNYMTTKRGHLSAVPRTEVG
jgi:hypothetical protein